MWWGAPSMYVAYTRSGTSVVEELPSLYTVDTSAATTTSEASSTITQPPSSIDSYWTSPEWLAGPATTPPCQNATVLSRSKWTNATLPWPALYYSSLLCCDELHSSWSRNSGIQSRLWQTDFVTRFNTLRTHTSHATRAVCSGPFTTLCDGVTRALCSPMVPMSLELIDLPQEVETFHQTKSPSTEFSYLEPSPLCKVANDDCTRLWEDRMSFKTSITNPLGYFEMGGPEVDDQPPIPACLEKQFGSCDYCMFEAATVDFLHWEEMADESHLCRANNTIPRPSDAPSITLEELKTAQWNGFTLTSPTPYVLFRDMTHEGGCGVPRTSVLLPVLRDQVSSMDLVPVDRDGQNSDLSAVKLNYKDLAYTTIGDHRVPLVPHSSYLGDQKCPKLGDECKTIYDDYQPVILFRLVPGEIEKVEPAWKYCDRQQFIARDPPIALLPTAVPTKPTIPALATGLPASRIPPPDRTIGEGAVYPGVVPDRPYVVQTHIPQPQPQDPSQSQPKGSGTSQGLPHSLSPNNEPDIIVSTASFLTIHASFPDGRQMPGLAPVASDPYFSAQSRPSGEPKAAEGAIPTRMTEPDQNNQQAKAVFTHAGKIYTATSRSPGRFVIDGSALSIGGSALTIHGAIVSAINGGIVVQAGSASAGRLGSSLQSYPSGSSHHGFDSFGEGNSTSSFGASIADSPAATAKIATRKKSEAAERMASSWERILPGIAMLAQLLEHMWS